ncbi:MAG: hypothetical protein AB1659_06780 [Thermodesulfobacteriota bacterium]
MNYLFHIGNCVGLVLLQTTILKNWPHAAYVYDLSIPYVVYLSLFFPLKVSLPIVLLTGYFMDGISSGPFGLYMSIYFWMTMAFRRITGYLQINSISIIPFAVGIAVLAEDIILMLAVLALKGSYDIESATGQIIASHFLLAVITGPLIFLVMKWIYERRGENTDMGPSMEKGRFFWPTI